MNCLLLLIILFCCNGNSCNGNFSGRNFCNRNSYNESSCNGSRGRENYGGKNCMERNKCEAIRREEKYAADNRSTINDGCSSCPQSNMSRTQFPYLEIEPRTCGCEEKENS